MKKHFCIMAKHITVFATLLFALWLLLFLSSLIPNKEIRDNMLQSVLSYRERDAFQFVNGDKLNSVADHYADSIWLNIAWNIGEGNALESTIRTNYYDGGRIGENAGLYYTVMDKALPNTDYTRYWHGTTMFIRLFHIFTDVEGIKTIGFTLFVLLAALSIYILIRKGHCDLAVMLVLSLIAVQIWNIRLSIEYQPTFILAFVMIPLYLVLEQRSDSHLTILSVVSGTVTAFFDFLTTETVTILLPLALVVAVRIKENRLDNTRQSFVLLIKCMLVWVCAYCGTFLMKWTIASIVTQTNAFAAALSSVNERVGSTPADFVEKANSFLFAPLSNLTVLFGGKFRVEYGILLLGLSASLLILLSVWYLFRKNKERHPGATLLLFLGFIVLIRFLVLNNHSYMHCFFTYRALTTMIFAMLSALWLNIELPRKKGRQK